MGSFSIWHWMLFIAVALLLFGGKGKISDIMGDVAKGIKSFKKGLSEDETKTAGPAEAPRALDHQATETSRSSDLHKIG
ncbi:MAG: twin-arginine translocase TatA/TatE family subunit [Beijerinckiaceae bacterium]